MGMFSETFFIEFWLMPYAPIVLFDEKYKNGFYETLSCRDAMWIFHKPLFRSSVKVYVTYVAGSESSFWGIKSFVE